MVTDEIGTCGIISVASVADILDTMVPFALSFSPID